MTPRLCSNGVSSGKRSHVRRFALLLSLCALALPASAGASETIGQLAPFLPAADCPAGSDYLQPSVTGGNLYVARQAGTITSWSTYSNGAGATYVVKIFRRTTDPDSFQVMARSSPHMLDDGLNTVSANLPVRSGDMIGLHESGPDNSCTFVQPGDNVLDHSGDLGVGTSGVFAPVNDVRLNLSAVLAPDNSFSISSITKNRHRGTAQITVTPANTGDVSISGKGLKKREPKSVAVAGPVSFGIRTVGKTQRKLIRKGRVSVTTHVTFQTASADPSVQALRLTLLAKRPPAPTHSP